MQEILYQHKLSAMDETDTRRFIQNELSIRRSIFFLERSNMESSTKVPLLSNEILCIMENNPHHKCISAKDQQFLPLLFFLEGLSQKTLEEIFGEQLGYG